jgi:predicted nucleic acid-binding protein
MPDAVSDSSPLIHLAKIEALELISRLYSRILIPPAVWQEVVEESEGRPGAVESYRLSRALKASGRTLEDQVPANRKQDDLRFKLAPLE